MRFDVDISGLEPGSAVSQAVCEKAIGFARESDKYGFQFALLQLADHVQRLLWKADCRWTVTTRDGEILILTHEQASKYNAARFNGAMDKMRRCHKRLCAVDIASLSDELRGSHDEAIARQSRILQGIKGTRAVLELTPTKRTVPLVAAG